MDVEFRILGPLEVSAAAGVMTVGRPDRRAVSAAPDASLQPPSRGRQLIDSPRDEVLPETARHCLDKDLS